MIDLIKDNLTTILGLTSAGAFTGGVIGLIKERIDARSLLSGAMLGEARTLVESLEQFRNGMGETESGFAGILEMIAPKTPDAPEHVDVDLPTGLDVKPDDSGEHSAVADIAADAVSRVTGDKELAGKIVAAVLAIPALPQLPDFARNFESLADNEMFSAVFDQLSKFDTGGVNTMLDEFKTLIESTVKTGLDKANADGLDFILEPETLDTLSRSAGEFVKTIGGMNSTLGGIMDQITKLLD